MSVWPLLCCVVSFDGILRGRAVWLFPPPSRPRRSQVLYTNTIGCLQCGVDEIINRSVVVCSYCEGQYTLKLCQCGGLHFHNPQSRKSGNLPADRLPTNVLVTIEPLNH